MFKSLFWNVRGLDNSITIARLRKLRLLHKFSLLGVCEPKMDASRFDWIRQRLGFDGCCPTNDGRLVVFYSSEFSCSIVGQSSQYLALRVTHSQMSTEVVGVFVHAACSVSDRRELWADLRALQVLGLPLLFHGDFNVILYAEEKRGGRPFRRA